MQANPLCHSVFVAGVVLWSGFTPVHTHALTLAPNQDNGITVTMTATSVQNATNLSAPKWEMRIAAVHTNTQVQVTNNFTSITSLVKHVMRMPVCCEGIFVEIHCVETDLEIALKAIRRVGWIYEYSRIPILYRLHGVPPAKWTPLTSEEVHKAMSPKEASLTQDQIREAVRNREDL
jgi:hypothetical protein